jgi:hypothetical protein
MTDDTTQNNPQQDNTNPMPAPQGQDDTQVTQPSAQPQDNGTPAQPPMTDEDPVFGEAHPATDNQTNVDSQEAQDEGQADASVDNPPTPPQPA